MEKTLDQVEVKHSVKVLKVGGEGRIRHHLFDLGVTPGVEIYVRKVAPLGDPIEVTIRGYELSLRKSEAQLISVTEGK
ncbi:MAG: ferrous iron transport protein A [Erysipelotrichaceae bacterium]|jgi:Fe2+ transport system protein FeoA|nr:ferrous iron transport protein A [Erysipelotrichaceae bacterium]